MRFGDYLNSIPLPAILAVFKAEEWDNFGLLTVNSSLIYSIIDVLLGGRRGQTAVRVEGRPYTTIETSLVKRMIEVVLADAELAFKPLSPVKFNIDRLETNPRFAAISRPANAAILMRLRIDMEDRGGKIEIAAALRDDRADPRTCCCRCSWARSSAATRSGKAISPPRSARPRSRVDAVLYEAELPLRRMMNLKVGDTLMLELKPDALVTRALRRRHADRRPHGPGRRPRRGARRQAAAQAADDIRHVREGGRSQAPGWRLSDATAYR